MKRIVDAADVIVDEVCCLELYIGGFIEMQAAIYERRTQSPSHFVGRKFEAASVQRSFTSATALGCASTKHAELKNNSKAQVTPESRAAHSFSARLSYLLIYTEIIFSTRESIPSKYPQST